MFQLMQQDNVFEDRQERLGKEADNYECLWGQEEEGIIPLFVKPAFASIVCLIHLVST